MFLEAVALIGLVAVALYATISVLVRPTGSERAPAAAGQWRVSHHDHRGATRVVLEKVSVSGREVLDEHVIETIRVDDPDYDAKFLQAMSRARERRALFESEEAD